MERISFRRCIRPQDVSQDPSLIMFSHVSEQGLGTCVYVRWVLTSGKFESRLMAAKRRVALIKKLSVVRLELNATVLSKTWNFIKEETRLTFRKEYFIDDSGIVSAMIQKKSYGFNTFVARIGEIQTCAKSEYWKWVESKWNIADWTTRGKHPTDLGKNSCWQKGPEFLRQPECEWPVKTDCRSKDLPEQNKFAMQIQQATCKPSISNCIDIACYSWYKKLIRVTARALSVFSKFKKRSLRNALKTPDAESLKQAETMWIREAQRSLKSQIKTGSYQKLNPTEGDYGIIIVTGCAGWRLAMKTKIWYYCQGTTESLNSTHCIFTKLVILALLLQWQKLDCDFEYVI